jgi:endonuclease YncB( thermonuclease family)
MSSAGPRARRLTAPFSVTVALCAVLLLCPGPARVAFAQQVELGDGEAVIRNGDGVVMAGHGCALIENSDQVVSAGSCDERDGGDPERPDGAPPDETTSIEETTREEMTSPEETSSEETTSPEADDVCPTEPPGDAIEATVERAVDGDTLELSEEVDGKDTVRLIGVDTPEPEGEGGEPEPYAEEAASFTAEALEGAEALLQIGDESEDDYGRLLAYVWTAPEDGAMGGIKRVFGAGSPGLFNRTLLEEGYAEVLTVEPNDFYEECFEQAERRAREGGAGIWGAEETSPEDQYEEQTGPEDAAPESTGPEETIQEEITSEESTLEDTVRTSPPDDSDDTAAGDQYEAETPPEQDTGSVPDYEKCERPSHLDAFSGDGRNTEAVDVPNDSFLLAYRTEELEGGGNGVFLMDVYPEGSDEPSEEISYEEVGTERTYVAEGPGTFVLVTGAEGRRYDVAVYGCGEVVEPLPGQADAALPEQGTEESIPPEGTAPPTGATEESASRPTEFSTTEVIAAESSSPEPSYGEQDLATDGPASPPIESLPVRQTSRGTVPVLPDTGGQPLSERSPLALGLGLIALGFSTLLVRRAGADGERR